jgi:tetratricopeptide (TPR) repeat protein
MPNQTTASNLRRRSHDLMRRERWPEAIQLFESNLWLVRKYWEFSWNLGWCYFKIGNWNVAEEHLARADQLSPDNHTCKWGLGSVYLKKREFKKAERALVQATRIKKSTVSLASLALAHLSQGKIVKAAKAHLENIRLHPARSRPYRAYAAFLYDVGRKKESAKMNRNGRRREIAEAEK